MEELDQDALAEALRQLVKDMDDDLYAELVAEERSYGPVWPEMVRNLVTYYNEEIGPR